MRHFTALRGACAAPALAALAALALASPAAARDAGVVSQLRGIQPPVSGLDAEVVGGDKFMTVRNGGDATVVVLGYDDEPYLRFLPGGRVQVNTRSVSKYQNEDRYALQPIPPEADSSAPPEWKTVATGGTYRWFDHRIHLMEKGTPPQVKDKGTKTKIFDWKVPIKVDGRSAGVLGTLTWEPASSSSSGSGGRVAALAALLAALLGVTLFTVHRRRRRAAPATAGGEGAAGGEVAGADETAKPKRKPSKEVW